MLLKRPMDLQETPSMPERNWLFHDANPCPQFEVQFPFLIVLLVVYYVR